MRALVDRRRVGCSARGLAPGRLAACGQDGDLAVILDDETHPSRHPQRVPRTSYSPAGACSPFTATATVTSSPVDRPVYASDDRRHGGGRFGGRHTVALAG
jgi:hypothetical protein